MNAPQPPWQPQPPAQKQGLLAWMARHKALSAVFIVAAFVVAIVVGSGGDDEAPETSPAERQEQIDEALGEDSPEPMGPRCLKVGQTFLDQLEDGAENDVGNMRLTHGRAIRSSVDNFRQDGGKFYLVAARLIAPGVNDPVVAVWATSEIKGSSLVLAANRIAQQFTVYPDADGTDAEIDPLDPEVVRAENCV